MNDEYDMRIKKALRSVTIPPLSPDFAERVIAKSHARYLPSSRQQGLTLMQVGACTFLFWIGIVMGITLPEQTQPRVNQNIFNYMTAVDVI